MNEEKKKYIEDSYSVICNETREKYKAGEQFFIFYGGLNNRSLLVERDFCIADNKYDSVYIYTRLDIKLHKNLAPADFLAKKGQQRNL